MIVSTRTTRFGRWAFLLVAPFVVGCAAPPAPEARAPAGARGAVVWANTCDRCHNLRPPRQFTAEEWPVIVDHMRTRADLTRSEAEAVAAYLRQAAGGGERRGRAGPRPSAASEW